MRLAFLTLATIALYSCGHNSNNQQTSDSKQVTQEQEFVANPELVNELVIFEGHNQEEYPFIEVESQTVDLNNDGKTDKITLLVIENWNDPGNFQKIRIEISGKEPYEFSNYSGWVTFNENYSISKEIEIRNQLLSNNILLLNTTPTSKLILIFGYVYANDPGLVTIIDPATGTILFNKLWDLQQITDANSDNFLELHGTSVFDGTSELLDFSNSNIQLLNEK